MKNLKLTLSAVVALLAGCSAVAPTPDYDALMKQMMATSFRDEGIATASRLQQDAANAECSKAQTGTLPDDVANALQQAALKTVKMPADGKFLGDWRRARSWRRTAAA